MEDGTVIVIGAGTAGSQAARTLGRAGRRVVVAERAVAGGTCLWRGCVPKKALYAAGVALQRCRRADRMGAGGRQAPDVFSGASGRQAVDASDAVDWARTLAWQAEVMHAYAGDQEGILRDTGAEIRHGTARFVDPDAVEVGGETLRADHVVVAAGSRPVVPPIAGADLMDTSDDALFYEELPGSLVVVGGGYVGAEMAGIYASFGTAVRLLVRERRVLQGFDAECAEIVVEGLRRRGVEVHFGTEVREVRGERGALEIAAEGDIGRESYRAERVLAATGRRPALADLDLGAAGVEVDDEGRPRLDGALRSVSNPRVRFAGDAAGGRQLTPVAGHEGRWVAEAILGGSSRSVADAVIPSTCFTAPEVSRVGLLEPELAERGAPYRVARGGFAQVAQAIIRDERPGLVKLLFDDRDRLAGAHVAGPSAGELIYGLALALQAGATLDDLQTARAVHPTVAEAVSWAAASAETVTPGEASKA